MALVTSMEQLSTPQTEPLSWRAFPARQRPAAAVLAGLAIAGVALACAALGGVFWGILAAVGLLGSLHHFFFPSRFIIDSDGVAAAYLLGTRRLAWSRIRRFCWDRHGLYLSTRSRRSRLDAYRGLHLLFGDRREEVLCRVRARLGRKDRVRDGPVGHVSVGHVSNVPGTMESCPASNAPGTVKTCPTCGFGGPEGDAT
jgi:hypothetical protein